MFAFTHETINVTELRQRLNDDRAGAFACFEGRVRNHNDGRDVRSLAYEAYEELGVKEGNKIMALARKKFALVDALCLHRLGPVPIGEVAVWVGVLSAHRDAAFEGCRFIIDEVKHVLPIWKKEEYRDGTVEWVNCQGCSEKFPPKMTSEQFDCSPAGNSADAANWELDVLGMSRRELLEFELVDVSRVEGVSDSAAGALLMKLLGTRVCNIPPAVLTGEKVPLDAHRKYLLLCEDGNESRMIADRLRMRGCHNVFFVSGGMNSIKRKFIA